MKTSDKQELVRLLHLYMEDIIADNDANIREVKKHKDNKWAGSYKNGLKAQYEHARVLATKLAVDVGKEIKSTYELWSL